MSKKKHNPSIEKTAEMTSQGRKPILKFAFGLATVLIAFFFFSNTDFFHDYINVPIVKVYAVLGNAILNVFGFETEVAQATHIRSALFDMNIGKGCDAVFPTFLFMAAVMIYPTEFSNKWKWLLVGPFAFAALNLVRIISLYLLGAYAPDFFEFAHTEVWQAVFIGVSILAWFYWLLTILNKKTLDESV